MKIAVTKGLRKICFVVLIFLISIFCILSCTPSGGEDGLTSVNTVEEHYAPSENRAFCKVKIKGYYDGVYKYLQYHESRRLLLVECELIEDYYGVLNAPMTVLLPINLYSFSKNIQLDAQAVKDFLSSYDTIYIYSSIAQYIEDRQFLSTNGQTALEFEKVFSNCSLSTYHIIPTKDGKMDIEAVEQFSDEHNISHLLLNEIVGMDEFCTSGMDENNFAENIKRLYENLSGREKSLPLFHYESSPG